ncbi:MAG: hypothetical protein BWK80_55525 [Desulfobacteraceae bacterium IS3]|nr:MAG: hypothetical protein BWK80_55525 [Desulfobacteraceae bacterium IS3]
MEELLEIRRCIEEQRYPDALLLIGELEEMSREDKINKIYSYTVILLLHLIKQEAEQRSTRSWEFAICNSLDQIVISNTRRKAGGVYVHSEELHELLREAYPLALKRAAIEAFEGQFTEDRIEDKIDPEHVRQEAFRLIQEALSARKK